MYKRLIENHLKKIHKKYKCITLIGPRQSGKTTLAKKFFKNYEYYSFEDPDTIDIIRLDPRGFLNNIHGNAILDEVQKYPEIFSYLQGLLDDQRDKRCFVLTGSNNLKISEKISQSLAGRTRILEILPFKYNELPGHKRKETLDLAMFYGGFPRIFHKNLTPMEWIADYYMTYIEKDVRNIINIENIRSFDNFVRLLAGRVGQLVNYNSLGSETGITHPTAKKWISALETSYICFILSPHFKNFSKRITKAPKIYFYDTALLCYLLRIRKLDHLKTHPLRGAIFENWVISEYIKHYTSCGESHPLYFWRDQHGHEVDLVIDSGTYLDLVEVKSSATFHKSFFSNINWLNALQDRKQGSCIYGGDKNFSLNNYQIKSWKNATF